MDFKRGDAVEQILPEPIRGTVTGFELDQENGQVMVRISYPDGDGGEHSRCFRKTEVKLIAEVTNETPAVE